MSTVDTAFMFVVNACQLCINYQSRSNKIIVGYNILEPFLECSIYIALFLILEKKLFSFFLEFIGNTWHIKMACSSAALLEQTTAFAN